MQMFQPASASLLLKEKNNEELELLSEEALEDDLEMKEDLEDLPI